MCSVHLQYNNVLKIMNNSNKVLKFSVVLLTKGKSLLFLKVDPLHYVGSFWWLFFGGFLIKFTKQFNWKDSSLYFKMAPEGEIWKDQQLFNVTLQS